jgi:hypothetical protein
MRESPGLFQFIQKIDPYFPQIVICATIGISHFLFRFFRNHESHHHHGFRYLFSFQNRLLINPMTDGSEKALKQGAILQIIF